LKIKSLCEQCGKETDNLRFCCPECWYEWNNDKNHYRYKGTTKLICVQCGKEYEVLPHRIDTSKFCSTDCHNEWQSLYFIGTNNPNYKEKIKLICEQCGIEYERDEAATNGARFCTQKCYGEWKAMNIKGKDNPQYGRIWTEKERRQCSARQQGITYDEWEFYVKKSPYCPAFNEKCRESNREKYGRRCFLCDLSEFENITVTNKQKRLSVHHYDMDKMQGCDDRRWKLVPLCLHCHGGAHNNLWESRIIWLLKNIWYKDDLI